jgi:hypothetical protein
LVKTGFTNVDPAPETSCERAGVRNPLQHNTETAINEELNNRRIKRLRDIRMYEL